MACVEGNCPFESNPDPSACLCPPCPNFRLCKIYHIPQVYLDIHRGTCGNCAASFGKALSFVEQEFECSICLDSHSIGIKHPSGCDHVFCVPCIHRLFIGTENFVDPGDYGYDSDGNSSLDEWCETEEAEEYNRAWDEQERINEQSQMDTNCPLCRREAIPDWKTKVGAWA